MCSASDTASHLCPSCLLSCSWSAVEFLSSLCNRHSPSPWQTVLGAGARLLSLGVNVGVAVGYACVHTGMCAQVLSAGLATPSGVEAAASILFSSELFLCQGVGVIGWLSKKAFREEG